MSPLKRASRWPIWIGLILSASWFAVIGSFVSNRWGELLALDLNELGDLLAGVFAPPAVLWLVVGYFQHAQELSLQVDEIRLQVKAAQKTAAAALKQTEHDVHLAQPLFRQGGVSAPGAKGMNLRLSNRGEPATDVSVGPYQGGVQPRTQTWPLMDRGDSIGVVFLETGAGWFEISYTDRLGTKRSVWVYYFPPSTFAFRPHGQGPLDGDELISWLQERL